MIEEFKETVGIATRFLDNVIDYNLDRHALDTQKKMPKMIEELDWAFSV